MRIQVYEIVIFKKIISRMMIITVRGQIANKSDT